jgi:hypothetical protein
VLSLLTGCAVDDRTFVEELDVSVVNGGATTGGRFSGPASGGQSSTEPPDAGGNGGAAGASAPERACPDLDENGVEDCSETLVSNADFSRGIELWRAEPDILIREEHADASENVLPASLRVESIRAFDSDALATAGASQCVLASGEGEYAFFAHVFLPEGQESGSAGISALFFDSEDCSGVASGAFMSKLVTDTEQWLSVGGTSEAPPTALSVSVRLLTVKPFRQPKLEALFDDVLVRVE